jgi:acyl-CoA dehydrogenase
MPGQFRGELQGTLERAVAFAEEVASSGDEPHARQASNALYHTTTAILLACEGVRLGTIGQDARRLVISRMVLDHRLRAHDPLRVAKSDEQMVAALLDERSIDLDRASALVAAA